MSEKRANFLLARAAGLFRRGRGELLSTFALLIVGVLVAGLGISSLVVMRFWDEQVQRQSLSSAPIVMNLATRAAHNIEPGAEDALRKLAGDCARLPNVAYCKITPA